MGVAFQSRRRVPAAVFIFISHFVAAGTTLLGSATGNCALALVATVAVTSVAVWVAPSVQRR